MVKNGSGIPEEDHTDVDYYAALGKILVNFQSLESAINILCHCLLTLPKNHSDIILSEMSFKNKIQVLSCVGKDVIANSDSYKKDEDLKKLNSLIDKVSKSEAFRNKIVHSEWNPYLKTQIKTTAKVKKGLHVNISSPTVKELDNEATIILTHISDVLSFSQALSIKLNRFHGSILLQGQISFHQPLKGIQDYFLKKKK